MCAFVSEFVPYPSLPKALSSFRRLCGFVRYHFLKLTGEAKFSVESPNLE